MNDRPTLFLTNFGAVRSKRLRATLAGYGRVWSVLQSTMPYHLGEGRVAHLTPPRDLVRAWQRGEVDNVAFARRWLPGLFLACEQGELQPGRLHATTPGGGTALVEDGDTLCCYHAACHRDPRGAGACHLAAGARVLVLSGWRVVMDGKELEEQPHWRPSVATWAKLAQPSPAHVQAEP